MADATIRTQCDKNAGRTGGHLVAVLHAPAGRYELLTSYNTEPTTPAKAATWTPHRALGDACELLEGGL